MIMVEATAKERLEGRVQENRQSGGKKLPPDLIEYFELKP
jgi:hypothetical protein